LNQCLSNLIGSIQLREPELNVTIYDMGFDGLEHLVASSWQRVTVIDSTFFSPFTALSAAL
jgi:hypothetical protein